MTKTLVEVVKSHAIKHYEDGGWDVIVECWSDDTIADCLRDFDAATPDAAIAAVGQVVGVYADRQADARNSAF